MHVMKLHDFSNIWSIQVHEYITNKVKDAQYVINRLLNCQVNNILSKLKIQLHYITVLRYVELHILYKLATYTVVCCLIIIVLAYIQVFVK